MDFFQKLPLRRELEMLKEEQAKDDTLIKWQSASTRRGYDPNSTTKSLTDDSIKEGAQRQYMRRAKVMGLWERIEGALFSKRKQRLSSEVMRLVDEIDSYCLKLYGTAERSLHDSNRSSSRDVQEKLGRIVLGMNTATNLNANLVQGISGANQNLKARLEQPFTSDLAERDQGFYEQARSSSKDLDNMLVSEDNRLKDRGQTHLGFDRAAFEILKRDQETINQGLEMLRERSSLIENVNTTLRRLEPLVSHEAFPADVEQDCGDLRTTVERLKAMVAESARLMWMKDDIEKELLARFEQSEFFMRIKKVLDVAELTYSATPPAYNAVAPGLAVSDCQEALGRAVQVADGPSRVGEVVSQLRRHQPVERFGPPGIRP